MIQQTVGAMIKLMLARWVMNDMPHAAGLLDNGYERPATSGQIRYIAVLCQRLEITMPYEGQVKTFGEAGRMITELKAEKKHRKRLESSNPNTATGTCYEDAWRFFIKQEGGYLIHGTVISPIKRTGHAWVETDAGFIWEPQTGDYFRYNAWQAAAEPIEEARYTPEEAAIMVARSGKHGPWTAEERTEHIGR